MVGQGGSGCRADGAGAHRCSGLHRVQTEGEVIEQGRQHLQSYLGELLDAIGRSAPACPLIIRAVFRQLFHRVGERFPQHQVGLRWGMDCGSNGDIPRRQGCNPQLWGPLLGMGTAPQGWVQGDSRAMLHPNSIPGAETNPRPIDV